MYVFSSFFGLRHHFIYQTFRHNNAYCRFIPISFFGFYARNWMIIWFADNKLNFPSLTICFNQGDTKRDRERWTYEHTTNEESGKYSWNRSHRQVDIRLSFVWLSAVSSIVSMPLTLIPFRLCTLANAILVRLARRQMTLWINWKKWNAKKGDMLMVRVRPFSVPKSHILCRTNHPQSIPTTPPVGRAHRLKAF